MDRGGIVGADGPTHHGLFDFSYLRHIPNLIVMAPKDENELQHMLKTAVCCGQPASVRYPRGNGWKGMLDEELKELPIGKGEVLEEGEDLVIVVVGSPAQAALEARELLLERGIRSAVINARFVKPLDEELIYSFAAQSKRVLTVEENALQGGFGSAVLEVLGEKGLKEVAVKRLGIPDVFVEHGSQEELRHRYGLDAEGIAEAAKSLIRESGIRNS
jgi:1-deoxy-D-xylulose-5-phosphate synthase